MLLTRFRNGTGVEDMAAIHNRTPAAIRARLEKLGQSPDQPPPSDRMRPPGGSRN